MWRRKTAHRFCPQPKRSLRVWLLLQALSQHGHPRERVKHHGTTRSFHLKRRYGVDTVQVAWMCLQQGGVCAICRTAEPVHVDHDHGSGIVRGILCFNCNRGIAKLGEDPELMRTAIAYLKEADEGD